jgi:gliding motility-associated-like protein
MSYSIIEFKNHKMARFVQGIFILLTVLFLFSTVSNGQITSPNADFVTSDVTNDSSFIFCTAMDKPVGELTAKNPMGVSATFSWEKFDTISGSFNPFTGDISYEDTLISTISGLEDGLYRVSINSGGNILPPYQAYILNNWIEITKAEIPDSSSTCDGFWILGDYKSSPMRYFDPKSNSIKSLRKSYDTYKILWSQGVEPVSTILNFYVSPPVASETPITYKLTVTDPFGCSSPTNQGGYDYISKVPKSIFGFEPVEGGEAVLKVTFSNTSINYDSAMWFFYKNNEIINKEVEENKGEVVDSIDFVLFNNAPVYEYEYEWAGEYKVKVVTVHVNPTTGNCYDTMYMKPGDFIQVDTALVEAPNVFTPNGDGINDVFVVKTRSLKGMTIHIYNRWGGLVHSWSYSNIRSRDYTYEHSVWDGKIGGRMASPGVYFYVITVVRRDDKPAKPTKGFFHLFRNKD